ncbi:MAG TPA: hypothetical protein P5205_02090 [Candidatus Paceibacterota bacterium]|nr:hypothetical protein [Verrucomicrobiota bacterium]HSA09137.1 hypothetical protein [Candidatus Paceibacterota bacterium]
MNTTIPPAPPPAPATQTPPPKRRSFLFYACGIMLALVVIIAATVAITLWWIQRPIKPVVLSPPEKAVVEEKLRHLSGAEDPVPSQPPPPPHESQVEATPPAAPSDAFSHPRHDRRYVPGSKMFKLTERELNGLLNANTDLGRTVRLELARDAINAYLAVPIPQDFPIGGGKMFRARGRFRVSLGNAGAPVAMLEDITVFGLSLPKAWLGGLKGENLLGDAVGKRDGSPIIQGIKGLRVEPGALVLEVED